MFKKYSEYKDSGVEWLGKIPKGWELLKSKYIWNEKIDLAKDNDAVLLSVSQYLGVNNREVESRSESLVGYKKVDQNDLVINIMLAWLGGLGLSSLKGVVSPAYGVYKLMIKADPRFLHYLYRTNIYFDEFARRSRGVVPSRWRMYTEDFGQVLTLLPSEIEQTAIANFLDRKTTQIDQAISIKEKQIQLLKERRQILIHNAVTRGLDPDVKMKDSGVEWIGEIPEHWEIQPIKYSLNGVVDCEHSTAPFVDETTYFVVRTSNVKNGSLTLDDAKFTHEKGYLRWTRRGIPEPGDILLTREAPAGEACLVPSDMKICLGQRMVWLKVDRAKLDSKLAIHVIYSKMIRTYIDFLSSGSTVLHFNMSDINNMPITLMPMEEQIRIRQYIEGHSQKIVNSISMKQKEIEKLKEYKSTLINSAVTGKIKVS